MNSKPLVREFYDNRCLFVTGATGFLGKSLVEKLIRSCPSTKRIYLLIRSTDKLGFEERFENFLTSKIFDRIRKENGRSLEKLTPIQGDLNLPNLGLSESDRCDLIENVSIIYHSAANVKFNCTLKEAILQNVNTTRSLLEFSRNVKNLTAFVYISTAYSNGYRPFIEETVYPIKIRNTLMDIIQTFPEEMIEKMKPPLIKNWPNTYTFSKGLTENMISEEFSDLPVVIIRPSVIGCAWKDPYPGWIDTMNGLGFCIVGSMTGIHTCCNFDPSIVGDVIPVDVVCNLIIFSVYDLNNSGNSFPKVINATSGSLNLITLRHVDEYICKYSNKYPSERFFSLPPNTLKPSLRRYLYLYLPAFIYDLVRKSLGKKGNLRRQMNKIDRAFEQVEFWFTKEFRYQNNEIIRLQQELDPRDKNEFDIDLQNLDWSKYYNDYTLGLRKFVLNQSELTIENTRKKLNFYSKIIKLITFIIGLLFTKYLVKNNSIIVSKYLKYILLLIYIKQMF